MKLVSDEETSNYFKNIQLAAAQGAVVGGILSLGLRALIKYRSPSFFSTAGGYHRALIYAGPAAFCAMTNMERMSVSYEQVKRNNEIKDLVTAPAENNAGALDWLAAHKYGVIVTGWAASMVGSFWVVNRSPFMTKAQKIVQARVYAQGLTVLMLLASVAFSVTSNDPEKVTEQKRDHSARSWERDLEYVVAANSPSK